MRSLSTASFRKQKSCPSAEMLLRYSEAGLTRVASRRVATHLAACDFCGAEMHLLKQHPPTKEYLSQAPEAADAMPASLHRLALDLLAEPSRAIGILAELIFERERLTLTDA